MAKYYEFGTVCYLNRNQDFGFIRADSGDRVFFHRNEVSAGDFDLDFERGSRVEFFVVEHQRGPRAKDIRLI